MYLVFVATSIQNLFISTEVTSSCVIAVLQSLHQQLGDAHMPDITALGKAHAVCKKVYNYSDYD